MTRNPRMHLILCMVAVLVLASVPFADARPLATSRMVERTDGGWIGAAVRWLEDLVGLQRSASDRTSGSPEPNQKGKSPTGSSCLDPVGIPRPWCI